MRQLAYGWVLFLSLSLLLSPLLLSFCPAAVRFVQTNLLHALSLGEEKKIATVVLLFIIAEVLDGDGVKCTEHHLRIVVV